MDYRTCIRPLWLSACALPEDRRTEGGRNVDLVAVDFATYIQLFTLFSFVAIVLCGTWLERWKIQYKRRNGRVYRSCRCQTIDSGSCNTAVLRYHGLFA